MPAVRFQKRHVGSFGGFFLGIFVKKITASGWAGMPMKRTRLDLIFSSRSGDGKAGLVWKAELTGWNR
jgi:hypothetical protein